MIVLRSGTILKKKIVTISNKPPQIKYYILTKNEKEMKIKNYRNIVKINNIKK
jgi:hypothetical protein